MLNWDDETTAVAPSSGSQQNALRNLSGQVAGVAHASTPAVRASAQGTSQISAGVLQAAHQTPSGANIFASD